MWKRRSLSVWRGLIAGVLGLMHDWWRVDRVRISPREGRLLRLRPPCLLRVRGQTAEVRRRSVSQTVSGPCVVYHCTDGRCCCQLCVTPVGNTHRPVLRWIEDGKAIDLSEDDVEVFTIHSPIT